MKALVGVFSAIVKTLPWVRLHFAALIIVDISAGADRLQVQLQQGAAVVQGGAQQLPREQLQHGRGRHTGVHQQDGGQEELIV